jgi:hypothetical protein
MSIKEAQKQFLKRMKRRSGASKKFLDLGCYSTHPTLPPRPKKGSSARFKSLFTKGGDKRGQVRIGW